MKVSVVIPVLNGEDAVVRCVEACLGQGRPPDEVIVVDNGSEDSTAERARLAGARVLSEEARGSSFARNRGWRAADADVVAFTDVDCVPAPDWLEELLAPFDDPSVAGVGGDIVLMEVHSAGQRWFVERHFLDQAKNTESSFLPFFATANAAFRSDVLEELGGFDGVVDPAGDTDFSWRVGALLHGRLVYRPQAVVHHDVSRDLAEVTGRWRRYAAGLYLLERRWADWPGFPQPEGFWSRTRRLWELPLALGNRMRTHRDLAVPFLDAAVAVNREIGRFQGRRQARHLDVVEIGHPSTLGSPVTSVPAGRP
ncbi:MAG TPA: glycosyltransferase [Acidimicrobiales bacterium]|nr:glycosyltransferase [Acidimicrobiales bacterium]